MGVYLTNSLWRDELAKQSTEEDENQWKGDPGQVLQGQVGLHAVVGPLVGCRDKVCYSGDEDGMPGAPFTRASLRKFTGP